MRPWSPSLGRQGHTSLRGRFASVYYAKWMARDPTYRVTAVLRRTAVAARKESRNARISQLCLAGTDLPAPRLSLDVSYRGERTHRHGSAIVLEWLQIREPTSSAHNRCATPRAEHTPPPTPSVQECGSRALPYAPAWNFKRDIWTLMTSPDSVPTQVRLSTRRGQQPRHSHPPPSPHRASDTPPSACTVVSFPHGICNASDPPHGTVQRRTE